MKATQRLHDLGQSLWLDNITRELLADGTLSRYIGEFAITGLTSNPTIFDQAIKNGDAYDDGIRAEGARGQVRRSAVPRARARRSDAGRGPVSAGVRRDRRRRRLGVARGVAAAGQRYRRQHRGGSAACTRARKRPNLFIKIPGTPEGVPAIEESIFAGVPDQRDPAVLARAVRRRGRGLSCAASNGASPRASTRESHSVASLFVSRWDKAVIDKVPADVAQSARHRGRRSAPISAYRELLASPRWQHARRAPARDRSACSGPAPAPRIPTHRTRCTSRRWPRRTPSTRCREKTLLAFAEHGGAQGRDGRGRRRCRGRCWRASRRPASTIDALAVQLQRDGAQAFVESWHELLQRIADKSAALTKRSA